MATLTPDQALAEVCDAIRPRDRHGEASTVIDVGTGAMSARIVLWPGAHLRLWGEHRPVRGDRFHWQVVGAFPPDLRPDAGPGTFDGLQSVPELAVAVLTVTARSLYHRVVIDAPEILMPGSDRVTEVVGWYARAKAIGLHLDRIAAEDRAGDYRDLAARSSLALTTARAAAAMALGIDPEA